MKLLAEIVLWSSMLTGCAHTLDLTLPATDPLKVQIHRNGRPLQECEIAPSSEQYKQLATWLSQNREVWSATPASYVPGVMISGPSFSINFLGGGAIVQYEKGQFSHPAKPKDYEFVRCDEHA